MELILPPALFACDACKREMPAATIAPYRSRLGVALQLCLDCLAEMEFRFGSVFDRCARYGGSWPVSELITHYALNQARFRVCETCDAQIESAHPDDE